MKRMAHHAEPERYATPGNSDQKVRKWLAQLSQLNRDVVLDRGRAALLVVDMQRFFFEPAGESAVLVGDVVIPNIRRLAAAFRTAGRPVVYTRHAHKDRSDMGMLGQWWDDGIIQGTPESEIVPELAPFQGDVVVGKSRYSAFAGTGLDQLLRHRGVSDLVVTGVMTNLCCETTAREAFVRDFRVFFAADGTGTATEQMHQASLLNLAYGFARVESVARLLDSLG
ncbi:MAG: isochorismatase family protein [candidate division WOR-3 bacterium]|nr:MAG: isochorismatase family protein [candidate division WOR-3 bacterium]